MGNQIGTHRAIIVNDQWAYYGEIENGWPHGIGQMKIVGEGKYVG